MKRKTFGTVFEVIRYYKPRWVGREIKIVGFLQSKRNFVHGFDQVIEVKGKRYDASGKPLGRKRLSKESAFNHTYILGKAE